MFVGMHYVNGIGLVTMRNGWTWICEMSTVDSLTILNGPDKGPKFLSLHFLSLDLLGLTSHEYKS